MWAKFSMADVCTWKRPLLSKIWVKSVKFCLYSTKTRCYGGVQQVHPMKSTENFDFNLQKARIFYSKARITREDFKPYWTTDRGKCFNPNCFRLHGKLVSWHSFSWEPHPNELILKFFCPLTFSMAANSICSSESFSYNVEIILFKSCCW